MFVYLPTEIIEEILLTLTLRDLIRLIRSDRRLWSIAHSPKSPLRHRLKQRTSRIILNLRYACDDYPFEMLLGSCWDEMEGVSNDVDRIEFEVEIEEHHRQSVTDQKTAKFAFVTKCCDIHYERGLRQGIGLSIEAERWIPPHKFYLNLDRAIAENNSDDEFHFKCKTLDDAMLYAMLHLCYLANYHTIVKECKFRADDNHLLLGSFLKIFEPHDGLHLGRIAVSLDKTYIDSRTFYASKLFANGIIDEISYSNVRETSIGSHEFVMHEKVLNVTKFEKDAKSPYLKDDQLLVFKNLQTLDLQYEKDISSQGLAKFILNIYKKRHSSLIDYNVRTSGHICMKDILTFIPNHDLMIIQSNIALVRNQVGENFRIEINGSYDFDMCLSIKTIS